MALPATDPFTAADSTALATYNASWTVTSGGLTITSNQVRGNSAADCYALWNADTFGNDQYAKATITGQSNGSQYRGVFARGAGTGGTFRCYLAFTDGVTGGGHTEIGIVTAGAYLALKAIATTFANSDQIEIRAVGTLLSIYKNGAFIDSTTDATYASGSAGLYTYGSSVGLDDWEGGNLTSGRIMRPSSGIGSGGMSDSTGGMQGRSRNRIIVPIQLCARELQRSGTRHDLRV